MSEGELVEEIKSLRTRIKTLEDIREAPADAQIKKLELKIETLEKRLDLQAAAPIDWDA